MRYNEVEELEATGEWLLRIETAGIAEELMYVPSQLSKLGVAPIDVVDHLEWLRNNDHDTDTVDHATVEVVAPQESSGEIEESAPQIFDYDSYGAWEWAQPVEKMVEDLFLAVLNEVPELPIFNNLVSVMRPSHLHKRTRGKKARVKILA